MSLYRMNESDVLLPTGEFEGIPIDQRGIFDKSAYIEVHIHPGGSGSMSISPNNASFLMPVTSPMVSLFSACVMPFHGEARLVITLYRK